GLYGMLMFAIVAVFVAGLMVGRTPEYLGKKIEAFEMKMASLIILIPPLVVLLGTAIAVAGPGLEYKDAETGEIKKQLNNPGAHGAVRGAAGRRRGPGRGADVYSGTCAGAGGGAFANDGGVTGPLVYLDLSPKRKRGLENPSLARRASG